MMNERGHGPRSVDPGAVPRSSVEEVPPGVALVPLPWLGRVPLPWLGRVLLPWLGLVLLPWLRRVPTPATLVPLPRHPSA